MEHPSPQRLTRSLRKAIPNRLQRLSNGSFKRKCDFISLSPQSKRRKRTRIVSAEKVEKANALDQFHLPLNFDENQEIKLIVLLPLQSDEEDGKAHETPSTSISSPFTIRNITKLRFRDKKIFGDSVSMAFSFHPESQNQTLNVNSETQNVDLEVSEKDGAGSAKGDQERLDEENAPGWQSSEEKDACLGSPCYNDQEFCRKESHRKNNRLCVPAYKWLRSRSRFAGFFRSIGVLDMDCDNNFSPGLEKDRHRFNGSVDNPAPAKEEPTKFPGKRKVSLSPRSQLKLLKASNRTTYRRLMPFCAELAKNLDDNSSAQGAQGKFQPTVAEAPTAIASAKEKPLHTDLSSGDMTVKTNKPENHVASSISVERPINLPGKDQAKPVHVKVEETPANGSKCIGSENCKFSSNSKCMNSKNGANSEAEVASSKTERKEQDVSAIMAFGETKQDLFWAESPTASNDSFGHPSNEYNAILKLETPASVPSKGILKGSPCACKGLCMCTDCVWFRTNAERSADFVERQLNEVEALVMPLMNELTNLKMLMGKPLLPEDVKEATESAFNAELEARNRLKEMAYDIENHCKIMRMQRRRVKFADKIEVKLFQSI